MVTLDGKYRTVRSEHQPGPGPGVGGGGGRRGAASLPLLPLLLAWAAAGEEHGWTGLVLEEDRTHLAGVGDGW